MADKPSYPDAFAALRRETAPTIPTRQICTNCAQREAATLLGLSICVVCAGIIKPS